MKDEGGRMKRNENGAVEPLSAYNVHDLQQRINLRERLKDYSLRVLRIYDLLPKQGGVHIITHQLVRSGTSPGAHYREACRAKSNADFISKVEGALQELDETDYWLELLSEGNYVAKTKLQPLRAETNELISIFVAMARKAKSRKR